MNIILFPDERLRQQAKAVKTPDIAFINRLKELMYINKGCVGVAAPQVGHMERIAIIDGTGHKKVVECHGLTVFINPEIIAVSGSSINREGCLSVPDYTGNVERGDYVKIKYMDINGEERIFETKGFEAVIAQHEIDHLEGKLFIDRITNTKRDLFARKKY